MTNPTTREDQSGARSGRNKTADRVQSRRRFLRQSLLASGAAFAALHTAGCRGLGDKPRERWQIGCYTRPWDQLDLRMALDGIAEAGFKYAGLMTTKGKSWIIITVNTEPEEAAQVGAEARHRGLKILSVYGGDFPVAKSIEAGIAGLQRLIDNCAACDAPHLMLGGLGDAGLYDDYFTVVRECCDYAAAKRVMLNMKPHGGLNSTGAQCRKAIERVGHWNFRIWYDPGNIYYYSDGKLDPVADAPSVNGLVVGMSVKDFRPPKDVMLTPGTGLVDFPEVMNQLERGGFTRGPLIVECLERGDLKKINAEAKKARSFLENLIVL